MGSLVIYLLWQISNRKSCMGLQHSCHVPWPWGKWCCQIVGRILQSGYHTTSSGTLWLPWGKKPSITHCSSVVQEILKSQNTKDLPSVEGLRQTTGLQGSYKPYQCLHYKPKLLALKPVAFDRHPWQFHRLYDTWHPLHHCIKEEKHITYMHTE